MLFQGFAAVLASTMLSVQISDIRNLTESGQFREALTQSQPVLDEYLGDPDFDFYYGLAALETGQAAEAALAFERILFLYPKSPRVRIELARAYFALGSYDDAREAFNTVLATNPPDIVKTRIQRFLDAIVERQNASNIKVSGTLSMAFGHDNNVNSSITTDTVSGTKFQVPFTISGDDQKSDDLYVDLAAAINVIMPLSQQSLLFNSLSINRKDNFDSNTYDTDQVVLSTSYFRQRQHTRVRIPVSLNALQSAGEPSRYGLNIGVDGTRTHSASLTSLSFLQTSALRYPDQHFRDSYFGTLGAGLQYQMKQWPIQLSTSVSAGADRVEDDVFEHSNKNLRSIKWGATLGMKDWGQLSLNQTFQKSIYGNPATDPIFADRRTDYLLDTSLQWSKKLGDGVNGSVLVQYSDNRSSAILYDYDRLNVRVGVQFAYD